MSPLRRVFFQLSFFPRHSSAVRLMSIGRRAVTGSRSRGLCVLFVPITSPPLPAEWQPGCLKQLFPVNCDRVVHQPGSAPLLELRRARNVTQGAYQTVDLVLEVRKREIAKLTATSRPYLIPD